MNERYFQGRSYQRPRPSYQNQNHNANFIGQGSYQQQMHGQPTQMPQNFPNPPINQNASIQNISHLQQFHPNLQPMVYPVFPMAPPHGFSVLQTHVGPNLPPNMTYGMHRMQGAQNRYPQQRYDTRSKGNQASRHLRPPTVHPASTMSIETQTQPNPNIAQAVIPERKLEVLQFKTPEGEDLDLKKVEEETHKKKSITVPPSATQLNKIDQAASEVVRDDEEGKEKDFMGDFQKILKGTPSDSKSGDDDNPIVVTPAPKALDVAKTKVEGVKAAKPDEPTRARPLDGRESVPSSSGRDESDITTSDDKFSTSATMKEPDTPSKTGERKYSSSRMEISMTSSGTSTPGLVMKECDEEIAAEDENNQPISAMKLSYKLEEMLKIQEKADLEDPELHEYIKKFKFSSSGNRTPGGSSNAFDLGWQAGRGHRRRDGYGTPHDRKRRAEPKRIELDIGEVELHTQGEDAWTKKRREDASELETTLKEIRSLLNKLSPNNYDKLKDKMCAFKMDSDNAMNGAVDIIFSKALSEPSFCELYAKLCSDIIKSGDARTSDGDLWGKSVRRCLLSRSQKEFELIKEVTSSSSVFKDAVAESGENKTPLEIEEESGRAKQRYLGNIRFIGELYKLSILPDVVIMHCVEQLADKTLEAKNTQCSKFEEEKLESLCQLLAKGAGKKLNQSISTYWTKCPVFKTFDHLISNRLTSSRIRFLMLDIIDMRAKNWTPRVQKTLKTKEELHKQLEKQKKEDLESMKQKFPQGVPGAQSRSHSIRKIATMPGSLESASGDDRNKTGRKSNMGSSGISSFTEGRESSPSTTETQSRDSRKALNLLRKPRTDFSNVAGDKRGSDPEIRPGEDNS